MDNLGEIGGLSCFFFWPVVRIKEPIGSYPAGPSEGQYRPLLRVFQFEAAVGAEGAAGDGHQ